MSEIRRSAVYENNDANRTDETGEKNVENCRYPKTKIELHLFLFYI